jgi:hypothetical protein
MTEHASVPNQSSQLTRHHLEHTVGSWGPNHLFPCIHDFASLEMDSDGEHGPTEPDELPLYHQSTCECRFFTVLQIQDLADKFLACLIPYLQCSSLRQSRQGAKELPTFFLDCNFFFAIQLHKPPQCFEYVAQSWFSD